MSTTITFNGSSYVIPAIADSSWGTAVGSYLIALASGTLQKTGGTFTLLAEVDFGATYGLKASYFKTKGAVLAAAGQFRLASTEIIAWRNAANGGDLALTTDGSDNLTFAGSKVLLSGGLLYSDLKTVVGNADKVVSYASSTGAAQVAKIVDANVDAAAAIAYSKLALSGNIVQGDLKTVVGNANKVLSFAASTGAPQIAAIVDAVIDAAAAISTSKIAGQITTTKKFLRSTGDGANAGSPTWDTIAAADVPTVTDGSATTQMTTGTQTIAGTKTFSSKITGSISGNCDGSSGSCTGNAATATTAGACSGNAATATTAGACSGNTAGTAANVTGTVAIANGGTGQTSAANALNALLPAQGSASGQFLTTNGSAGAWGTVPAGNLADTNRNQKTLENIAIACSVGTNALTIALKDSGGNDPSSGSPVKLGFRAATLTSGIYNVRTITGALSVVVPAATTLGTTSAVAAVLNVYAIDYNAGTIELAVCNGWVDQDTLQTTTAISGGATAGVLYSTTARTSVPVRWIGRLTVTEATAGTWATAPATVSVTPENNVATTSNPTGLLQAGAIPGYIPVTTSDKAAAGNVQEYIERVGSDASLTTGQWNDGGAAVATLLPGEYDLQAVGYFTPSASTNITKLAVSIGTTTGNNSTGTDTVRNYTQFTYPAGVPNGVYVLSTPMFRVSVATGTTQTWYPKVFGVFSASTMVATGALFARRVR